MSQQSFHLSFSEGQTMNFTVKLESENTSYSINLGHDPKNLALHFMPRYDGNETVCNSRTNGKWDEELKVKSLPFKNSTEHKLAVHFTKPSFRIQLPGGQHIEFPNRSGAREYKHFEIIANTGGANATIFEIK